MCIVRINGLTLFNTIFCNTDDFPLSPPTIMLSNEVFVKFELWGGDLGVQIMTFQDQHGHALLAVPQHFKLKEWYDGKWRVVKKRYYANPESFVLSSDISYRLYYEDNLKLLMKTNIFWSLIVPDVQLSETICCDGFTHMIQLLSHRIFMHFVSWGGDLGVQMTFQDQHGHALAVPQHFKLKEWYNGKWRVVKKRYYANPESFVLSSDISYQLITRKN